jgi:hypothetical protein
MMGLYTVSGLAVSPVFNGMAKALPIILLDEKKKKHIKILENLSDPNFATKRASYHG